MVRLEYVVTTPTTKTTTPCPGRCSGALIFPDVDAREWFQRDPTDTARFDGYCAACGITIENWQTSPKTSTLAIRVTDS